MENSKEYNFVIYFASQTGTAENFAEIIKTEAKERGMVGKVVNLADLTKEQFLEDKNAIFLMATHYEGDPPDNAAKFWTWFANESQWSGSELKDHKFTCFALGDTTYEDTFARIGQETNRLMLKYGAKSVYKLGIGSDDEDDIISYFTTWKKDIWPSLSQAFGIVPNTLEDINPISFNTGEMEEESLSGLKDIKRKLPYECIISSFKTEEKLESLNKENENYDFKFKNWLKHDTLRILNVTELREHPTEDNFTCLMELLLPKTQSMYQGTNVRYPVAGNISIYPNNTKGQITRLLKILNMPGDTIFSVVSKNGAKLVTPEVVSLENFAKMFIDLNGRVTQKDYGRLEEMLTEKEYYRVKLFREKMEKEKLVYDILDLLENVNITTSDLISVLVSLGKDIKPRTYSIASNPTVSPQIIQIAISCHSIQSENPVQTKKKLGLFSAFTKDIKSRIPVERDNRFFVQAKIHDSTFKLPTAPKTPIMCFANGAGVGIMRSLIQEKLNAVISSNHNHVIGTISLFFGTRTSGDFLFKGDFETSARARVLKEFKVAFSRQSGERKTYIQELIYPNKNSVIDYIIKAGGYVYICGSRGLKEGVTKKLKKIFDERNMLDYYDNLVKDGRIMFEVFG